MFWRRDQVAEPRSVCPATNLSAPGLNGLAFLYTGVEGVVRGELQPDSCVSSRQIASEASLRLIPVIDRVGAGRLIKP